MHRHPSMRELLADPLSRARLNHGRAPARPVITVSRQAGARGRELAQALGEDLGLRLYDREILQRIAQSAHLSERVVADLDEKDRPALTDMLSSLTCDAYLSPYGYLGHLTEAILAIARLGGAVILGRGGHLILRSEQALRVFVVAPLESRIATVAAREAVGRREAEHRIAAAEAERRAFLKRYFRAEFGDAAAFDLVVNTALLGIDGALAAVRGALARPASAGVRSAS
jgi:cytidylate kinase